ncbi:MAG TPA: Gfo/Idh/MocA family oxidoreductase [Egibacteraceae bacterium]|nr:Gfo/Idh/MocA family oxidoreductase [Egibacteraceae bacterium]
MRTIGVGLVGFGWMGQAHSRSYRRIPMLFADRQADPELVICADTSAERRDEAVASFGFREATAEWRKAVEHPDVDVVVVTAPNMLHVELVEAATAAGKHVFCEKPVGGTPAQTARASRAAAAAGVITGVGYNYRWAPMVRYAKQLIDDGQLGEIRAYRATFFSMYGSDPLGLLSWRFLLDQAGYGVTTDLLSHAVDLAHMLLGPIDRVVGAGDTFIPSRPLPRPGSGTHYDRGQPDDPTAAVTNEDWFSALAVFSTGARGTFEACRTLVGPESRMAFDVYGTEGALSWNLERMNELQVYLRSGEPHTGYTTVFGGERFPYHGRFVPGSANGIGFEDLIAIEDHEFLQAVARGEPFVPGFDQALEYVSVQSALLRSWSSQRWESVKPLDEE